MEGKNLTPLLIFPEGTISSGRHILKFNKGAFYNLFPVKPVIVRNQNTKLDLGVGVHGLALHLMRCLVYLWHSYEIQQLPILSPNEYMFKNFYTDKTEKWEVFAEVVRDVYSEIGGFQKTDSTLKDILEYEAKVLGRENKYKEVKED
jgi:hypothetical protein